MKTKNSKKINDKTRKLKKYNKSRSKSRPKSRKSKRGGSIIGRGKDGFIIDTIMYDKYNINNGYVSKIFNKGINVNKELNDRLKEIDPDETRFLYYIIPDSSFNKELLGNNEDIKEYSRQTNFLFDASNDVVFIKKLIPIDTSKLTRPQYRYLRKSLEILHENNISHGDLIDNIMLDPNDKNRPIIIDWENARLNATPLDKEIDYNAFMNNFKIQSL